MKVLIVEDSAILRKAIVKIVNGLGFMSVEAENGVDGLAKLRKNDHDLSLIILDWNMPVMDGYEFLTKIRSDENYDNIPVLMATADGVEEDVKKAIKAGANSYLVKPFSADDLSKRIEEVLK